MRQAALQGVDGRGVFAGDDGELVVLADYRPDLRAALAGKCRGPGGQAGAAQGLINFIVGAGEQGGLFAA